MLIGLSGRAGVGKTTVARLMVPDGYTIKTFATPLKESLAVLTGLSMDHFTDITLKEQPTIYGKTPRQMMQRMGTEFARDMVHKDFFTIRMKQALAKLPYEMNVVLEDCRFENELALVRELGGIVIHLDRYYGAVTNQVNHKSEQRLRILPDDIRIQSFAEDEFYTYKRIKEEVSI